MLNIKSAPLTVFGAIALYTVSGVAEARPITLATTLNANDISVKAMEYWNELLQERTDGELSINIMSGGTLGADRELIQQLSSGEIDLNLSSPVVLQYAAPEYQCLEAEYVYEDEDHGFQVWRGDIGSEVSDRLRENYNIEIMDVGRRGSRNVTSNRPIENPEDLSGLKMRVTNDLRAQVFENYGALPAPLSLSEVYGALRQGVFDAQENPLATIYSMRFHEVQDFINLTEHVWTYNIVYSDADLMDRLGDNSQVFKDTLSEAMDWLYEAVGEDNERIRNAIEESGETTFIEPNVAKFRKQARPVLEQYAKENCRPGLLEDIDNVATAE